VKKFLVLYHSTATAKEQMAKATPEQGKAGMEAWMKWSQKAGPSIVDLGSPIGPVGKANDKVGGFSILQGEDAKSIEQLLKDHPHRMAPGGTIEIHEFLQLPGM
jgi:hypothetical protein